MGHVDLIHDTPLKLDWKNDVILGSREFLINSNSDILAISKIIEKQRSTKPTKMNQASSRSHAFIDVTLYRTEGANIHMNLMRMVDLAGSERYEKSDVAGMEHWEAVGNNY